MNTARRTFVSALFRSLNENDVPYCVLRNYDEIYDETGSDIDLGVESEDVERLAQSLEEAARASGFHFVHRARYINHSFVYRHEAAGFLRIDLETEVRWRIFPVLTARSVIGLRRRLGEFYVPHPRHESVILFVAAIWRSQISTRYREQLARLYERLGNRTELERTFCSTLGNCGKQLAAWQARIREEEPPAGIWKAAKRSIVRNSYRDGPNRRALRRYLAQDAGRLRERISRPAGVSLLYASSTQSSGEMEHLLKRMEFLYPIEKSVLHSFKMAGKKIKDLKVGLKLARLKTLFKGGLFLRFYHADDHEIAGILKHHVRYLYPSRAFVAAETPRFGICLAHVETGFMAEFESSPGTTEATDGIIEFISRILERSRLRARQRPRRRGALVVLVGLDGSGKTTVARKICCQLGQNGTFSCVRYFHWQPKITREIVIPLPEPGQTKRKAAQEKTMGRSVLSTVRLFKNIITAKLAHRLRTRPLLRRGALVLVDRYYYNYFLDPVSVKYYGPRWLLERARKWFPAPEMVVVLKATPGTLLARKQELSAEEIQRQTEVLEQLNFQAATVLELDATKPPAELAERILDQLSSGIERESKVNPLASQKPDHPIMPGHE